MVTSTGEAADPAAGRRQVWSMQADAWKHIRLPTLPWPTAAARLVKRRGTQERTPAPAFACGVVAPRLDWKTRSALFTGRRALWILEVLMGLQLSVEAAAKAFKLRATWLQVAQQQKPKLPVFRPALA